MPAAQTPGFKFERERATLAAALRDMLAWIERPDFLSRPLDLFDVAHEAAGPAAILGFPGPPVEHLRHLRPSDHPLLQSHPEYHDVWSLRVNSPNGLLYFEFDLYATGVSRAGAGAPAILPPPPPDKVAAIKNQLASWLRRTENLFPEAVEVEYQPMPTQFRSAEQALFILAADTARTGGFAACTEAEKQESIAHVRAADYPGQFQRAKAQAGLHPVVATVAATRPADPVEENKRARKRSAPDSTAAGEEHMTARERKIEARRRIAWHMHKEGKNNAEIASELDVSEATVSRDLRQPEPL